MVFAYPQKGSKKRCHKMDTKNQIESICKIEKEWCDAYAAPTLRRKKMID